MTKSQGSDGDISGKKSFQRKLCVAKLRLGLVVALCVDVHYIVKCDVGNRNLDRSAMKSHGNVGEFHGARSGHHDCYHNYLWGIFLQLS